MEYEDDIKAIIKNILFVFQEFLGQELVFQEFVMALSGFVSPEMYIYCNTNV